MLIIYYKRLFVNLCLLVCTNANAQDLQQNLDAFSGKLISAIKSQDKPRVWLETDKTVFKARENIWFRGFLLNAVSQKVNTKSKYLFVDLVNEKDSVISVVLLDASTQQLNGQIMLPANTSPGYYWLRAYTKEMAVADTNSIFVKAVYVISKYAKAHTSVTASKAFTGGNDVPSIKFYSEGGAIMTGANSTVAFQIRDAQQNPVSLEGVIKDNRDSVVAHFSSNGSGMGKFILFPSVVRKYKAYITWHGKDLGYPLPPFNLHAGQVAVTKQSGGNITLRVLLEDSIYKKDLVTYVIGISKDSLCFAGIGRGLYQLDVAEQNFPEGIATFYLFDDKLQFLSERSVYIKAKNIIVNTVVDKNSYGKRDKVTLAVSVTDAAGRPVPALFSVAVIDTVFSNQAGECMPAYGSSLLPIDNFSLAQNQCLTEEALELLMLARTGTYLDMGKNLRKSLAVDEDSLLFIKGQALDEKNNPAANKILTLFSSSSNSLFVTDTTDDSGQFSFAVSNYMDSTQFAVDAKTANNKSMKVTISRDPFLFPHFKTPASLKSYFAAEPVIAGKYRGVYLDSTFTGIGKKLPLVSVKGIKKANYNELKRVSSSSAILSADQLDERTSVGNTVLNVGGMHLLNGYLVINGLTAMKAPDAGSEPLLIVDGVQTPSSSSDGQSPVMGALNSLNPNDIDFIEILKGPEAANFGVRGGNGVIIVNLSGTRREKFNTNNNLQTFYAKGITRSSLFPVINFDNKETRASEDFDNRATIFWDGSVLTGSGSTSKISFFTSDIPTTYRVTISGITVHGDIIYKTVSFTSK